MGLVMVRSFSLTMNTNQTQDILPSVTDPEATQQIERAFLSLDQAAALIDCSRRFLEIRIENGELKIFRPSKRLVRIKRSELDRWVESYSANAGGLT